MADEFVVDTTLNSGGKTYKTLNHFAEVLDMDDIPIRTINLEGLLSNKQTMRDKDVADRIILERALEALRDNAMND